MKFSRSSLLAVASCAAALIAVPAASAATVGSGSTITSGTATVTSAYVPYNDYRSSSVAVVNPFSGYGFIDGAQWINLDGYNGDYGLGPFIYTTSIDLPSNATDRSVTVTYYADDCAAVTVNNDTPVTCDPATAQYRPENKQTVVLPLAAGANTLRFDLINSGGPSALIFSAVVTYNLTPLTPTTASQCKTDGWKSYGATFKNQGDCVSFVATKGKNAASGS